MKTSDLTTAKRKWEYSKGTAKAYSLEPVAIYTVARKGKPLRWRVDRLTEVGSTCFPQQFHTMAAAQWFCENDVDRWRAEIRKYQSFLADAAA
jgi:hypothetical protein